MRLTGLLKDKELNILISTAIYIMILRILFIGIMGPMPQDAYYFFYSQHLALSYFDHPPAIAYLLRAFTIVFGKSIFSIKLADSIVTLLTLFSFINLLHASPTRKKR